MLAGAPAQQILQLKRIKVRQQFAKQYYQEADERKMRNQAAAIAAHLTAWPAARVTRLASQT